MKTNDLSPEAMMQSIKLLVQLAEAVKLRGHAEGCKRRAHPKRPCTCFYTLANEALEKAGRKS